MVEVDVRVLVALVAGEAGAEQRFGEACSFGDVHGLSVELGARATLGGEELIARGIVEEAGQQLFTARQGDRDAEHGIAVGEVGGAVEWIDQPAILGFEVGPGAFFAQDAEVGPAARRRSAMNFSEARSASVTRSTSPLYS